MIKVIIKFTKFVIILSDFSWLDWNNSVQLEQSSNSLIYKQAAVPNKLQKEFWIKPLKKNHL